MIIKLAVFTAGFLFILTPLFGERLKGDHFIYSGKLSNGHWQFSLSGGWVYQRPFSVFSNFNTNLPAAGAAAAYSLNSETVFSAVYTYPQNALFLILDRQIINRQDEAFEAYMKTGLRLFRLNHPPYFWKDPLILFSVYLGIDILDLFTIYPVFEWTYGRNEEFDHFTGYRKYLLRFAPILVIEYPLPNRFFLNLSTGIERGFRKDLMTGYVFFTVNYHL